MRDKQMLTAPGLRGSNQQSLATFSVSFLFKFKFPESEILAESREVKVSDFQQEKSIWSNGAMTSVETDLRGRENC